MKNHFSIGEMSRIHDVPIKTLRYYDEIGLFRPSIVNQVSGYRYYSAEQFERLNTINYLKFLGLSLKKIKQHMDYGDEQLLLHMLKEQQEATIHKMEKMSLAKNRFEKRIQEIEEALKVQDVGQVFIKRLPRRSILRIRQRITSRSELELSLKELEKNSFKPGSIFIGMVGLTVSQQALEMRNFGEYTAIFIIPEESVEDNPHLEVINEGEYACIYYREPFCQSSQHYLRLMDYIQKNNHIIIGDAVERAVIDNLVTRDQRKHLSEIQIPIKTA